MKINMENLYVDIGAWRVKRNGPHPLWAIGVYTNPAIEQKPAACCVVFKSNLPLPKHYILLRIPKRLIGDNLLFTAVYLKKGPDGAFVTFIIYFIFILDTTNKRHF